MVMRRVRGAALVLAALCVTACRRAEPEDRLVLGSVGFPAVGLVHVAMQSGCFAEERLAVVDRRLVLGKDALAALLAGDVDVATVFETPVAREAPAHPEIRILTTLHLSRLDTRLVARADRGIRSAADLAGKRVGVAPGTNAAFFLDTLLEFAEVPRQRVTIVFLAPDALPGALSSGSVDAIASWEPFAHFAEAALPAGASVTILSEVYTELSTLVTRSDLVERRGRALTKLVRCVARAERMTFDEPARAYALLRRALPDMPEPALRDGWQRTTPLLGLPNILVSVLRQESEWIDRLDGRPHASFDFASLLVPEILGRVEPEAVTFLRTD